MGNQTPPWGSDEDFDPQKAWDLIQNLRTEVKDLKTSNADTVAKLKTAEGERDAAIAKADDKANEGKSQADQLASQLADLQKKLADESHARLRAEVVASKGLTPAQAKRLTGTTLEELEADADDLLESFPSSPAGGPPSPKPRPSLSDGASGGSDPQNQEEKVDPAKLADAIPTP